MRGATGREANYRTVGTRLRMEQSLEVGKSGSWQSACGRARLASTTRGQVLADEVRRLCGVGNPWTGNGAVLGCGMK